MYNYGQYYPQYIPQMQRFQSLEQQYPQTYQQQINGLQGKSVESFDVARAIDIPIDGSISYFPLTDGSAIITKQLQMDGKSKTIIYKPDMSASSETLARTTLTSDESNYIKEELKNIKNQLRELGEVLKKGADVNESNGNNTTLNG